MSRHQPSLAELFEEAASSLEFEVDNSKLQFTDEMLDLMEEQGVNRSELAQRLGVKPARITALLRGDNNFTLETMIRICRALGVKYLHRINSPRGGMHWLNPDEDADQSITTLEGQGQTTSNIVPFPLISDEDLAIHYAGDTN